MLIALSALQQRQHLTGTGRHIAGLMAALPAAAPEWSFQLYLRPEQAPLYPPDHANYRQRPVPDCPAGPTARSVWELLHTAPMIRRDQVDLYHGPANFLPPRKACPYVLTLHDMFFFRNPRRTGFVRSAYWRGMQWATWRLAERIITVSEFSRGEIMRFLPVPAERIRVVPNGVEDRFFAPVSPEQCARMREALGLDRDFVAYVGRLDPDKNPRRVVEAFALLRASGHRDLLLAMAGAPDHQSDGVAALARRLGLGDSVRFLGHVAEEYLVPLYREAAVFCYPSLNEGFGLPPLEAMAAGAPVVTSNVSSLPEVVGDAAILVDPHSAEAIAAGMAQALQPSRARELREAGPARARQFPWSRAAAMTVEVYREALKA